MKIFKKFFKKKIKKDLQEGNKYQRQVKKIQHKDKNRSP